MTRDDDPGAFDFAALDEWICGNSDGDGYEREDDTTDEIAARAAIERATTQPRNHR